MDVLHRITKQFLKSVNTPSYVPNWSKGQPPPLTGDWIVGPDLSAVAAQPSKYWVITGNTVSLMSQAERDAVDAAQLNASRDATADQLDVVDDVLRAFALTVLDEINTLRAQRSLPARTMAQLKTAVRDKLGN